MGEADGKQGTWAYVEGGMGKISEAIASAASKQGAELVTNTSVSKINWKKTLSKNGQGDEVVTATGVQLEDGRMITARKAVVAGCSPYHAFGELMGGLDGNSELRTLVSCDPDPNGSNPNSSFERNGPIPSGSQYAQNLGSFLDHVEQVDMACGAFKINCAIDKLPNFTCLPNTSDEPGPQHRTTIHFESRMEEIETAYREASQGIPASRPVIEMTIPSSLDTTISPKGQHVAQLFVQYAPYDVDPAVGSWADLEFKNAFADRVFAIVDEYAPGFSKSVLHRDVLSPLDLEQVFGLPRGNIFHGALALHQLGYARPAPGFSSHRSPVKGLYLGSAGTHPGGGVMGAPGRNCARILLSDLGKDLK
jgi:phytoene dehydrogenase-like protein